MAKGRLVVHGERHSARPAVLMTAPPRLPADTTRGRPCREHGARLEIADGLLAVWSTTSWTGMIGDIDGSDEDAYRERLSEAPALGFVNKSDFSGRALAALVGQGRQLARAAEPLPLERRARASAAPATPADACMPFTSLPPECRGTAGSRSRS